MAAQRIHATLTGVLVCILITACAAQQPHRTPSDLAYKGFRGQHHPVKTRNPEAQRLFDEGLGLIYVLDYSGAAQEFQRAAALDPQMAMAYWGIAYALGSDYYYSTPGDLARERAARLALQNAVTLSTGGPAVERAYISALTKRYCDCANLDRHQMAVEFKDAMGELARNYPDDLDAATLYAQSVMNLNPWNQWNPDGRPREGTQEVLSILQSVLKRSPSHLGAMHYYLHAVEGSPHPEQALAYARILPSLAPTIGHIVHMPAHIYFRTGDFAAAEFACEKAAKVDEQRIQNIAKPGMFTILSELHDLYFLAVSASMDGHFFNAREAANTLVSQVVPHVKEMPMLETFLTVKPLVLVRFGHWDEILKLPVDNSDLNIATALLNFARGMAFASTDRLAEAESERSVLTKSLEEIPPDQPFAMSSNKAHDILQIASDVLSAKLSMARNQRREAIAQLRDAVTIQDGLQYSEPPSWFYPVRESLGAALFLDRQIPEAEQTFREDLQRNPRNPRSLFGLLTTLKSLGKTHDVVYLQAELAAAWKGDLRQLDLHNF